MHEGNIYSKGKNWKYKCEFYGVDGKINDSFDVNMRVKSNIIAWITQQIPIVYEYPYNSENLIESTGVIENNEGISIHQPRLGKFNFTSILPMPSVAYPLEHKSESQIETTVTKSSFPGLNGKIVKQIRRNTGTGAIFYKEDSLKCFVYESENINLINEFGKYHVVYWFNKEYGFVKYLYTKPNGEVISLTLVDFEKN